MSSRNSGINTISIERKIKNDKFQITITIRNKETKNLVTYHQTKFHEIGDAFDPIVRGLMAGHRKFICKFVTRLCIQLSIAYSQLRKLPLFIRYYHPNLRNREDFKRNRDTLFDENFELWITCDNQLSTSIIIIRIARYMINHHSSLADHSGEFDQFNKLKEYAEGKNVEDLTAIKCYKIAYIMLKVFYLKEFGEEIGNCLPEMIVPLRAMVLDYITG